MTWNNKRESMSQRSMLNQRNTEMSKTKEKWMVVKQKTLTYMEFPIHSFLWTQWTSETMNLGMGKRKGMVEWWMKGKEKQNKIRPTSQDTDLELDFFFALSLKSRLNENIQTTLRLSLCIRIFTQIWAVRRNVERLHRLWKSVYSELWYM